LNIKKTILIYVCVVCVEGFAMQNDQNALGTKILFAQRNNQIIKLVILIFCTCFFRKKTHIFDWLVFINRVV